MNEFYINLKGACDLDNELSADVLCDSVFIDVRKSVNGSNQERVTIYLSHEDAKGLSDFICRRIDEMNEKKLDKPDKSPDPEEPQPDRKKSACAVCGTIGVELGADGLCEHCRNCNWKFTPSASQPQGWLCPKCGKVNAPWKGSCDCVLSRGGGLGFPGTPYDTGGPDYPPYPGYPTITVCGGIVGNTPGVTS